MPIAPPAAAQPPVTEAQTFTLATVEMIADGTTVRFSHASVTLSIPTDTFAIRINNAGELKNFPVKQIEAIDLQSISEPIDLLPQADGSWKGDALTRNDELVEIMLDPTDDSF